MESKKLTIKFNYPSDTSIDFEEIIESLKKIIGKELENVNVAWEIGYATDDSIIPSYPPPCYPTYPTNPPLPFTPGDAPWWTDKPIYERFWWDTTPRCETQNGCYYGTHGTSKKNNKDKKE